MKSNPSRLLVDAKEFTGKRVLVTGGTKGMGETIVTRLIKAGATVITTARSFPDKLPERPVSVQSDLSTVEGTEAVI